MVGTGEPVPGEDVGGGKDSGNGGDARGVGWGRAGRLIQRVIL